MNLRLGFKNSAVNMADLGWLNSITHFHPFSETINVRHKVLPALNPSKPMASTYRERKATAYMIIAHYI